MNREFKFRVWQGNEMEYFDFNDVRMNKLDPTGYGIFDPVIMQYTGLKDKNGKEIYEDDICKFVIFPKQEEINTLESLLVVIKWENAGFGFRHLHPNLVHESDRAWTSFWINEDNDMWSLDYFEVIGNIYETKA